MSHADSGGREGDRPSISGEGPDVKEGLPGSQAGRGRRGRRVRRGRGRKGRQDTHIMVCRVIG